MFIKKARNKALGLNEALRHSDHAIPKTRREFISQGFQAGGASVAGVSALSLFSNPNKAYGALASDLQALTNECGIATAGAGKIPFICFDLAGGAGIASNVLVGGPGGQMDFLSTAGYSKVGIPGDMVPPIVNPATDTNDFINTDLGLAFHSDSQFLAGIMERTTPETRANINGVAIPARSENDTGNNPHNPMYAILNAGADGELLSIIGSRNSDSGGNSMAPNDMLMSTTTRPTKVDRPSDVTGLVDVGDLISLLSEDDAVAVMEAIERISYSKMGQVDTKVTADEIVKELVSCGYVKSASLAERYSDPTTLNPDLDLEIVGDTGIFSRAEFDSEGEFRKTASVMKLVLNGYAGAGTVTMGGFDYHTGERGTGETRDLRAGRCMGACLEYARLRNMPLMMYVFSDGGIASNGMIDDSVEGRGKGQWTGDNSSTATAFYLVYDPAASGRPTVIRDQIGYMRPDASTETGSAPSANNVNQLVQTVLLNYMALHGQEGDFANLWGAGGPFPGNHGLGTTAQRDQIVGMAQLASIQNGIIDF